MKNALIYSLNRAAVLKAVLAAPDGIYTREISKAAKLSKEGAIRHLKTLCDEGLIEASPARGKYGPPGFNLAEIERLQTIKAAKDFDAWAEHVPVHLVVKATEAAPLQVKGPASVWELAA